MMNSLGFSGVFLSLTALLLPVFDANAQSISGRVVSRSGEGVPGVSIRAGTKPVASTDVSGAFSIQIPDSAALRFSHIAFLPLDTVLSGSSHILVLNPATLESELLVVTATRTERDAESVAVPVSVVSKKAIQNSGQVRLANVLAEQTGLQLVSNFGTGLQVQGFDAEYTLIMIDGEPVIGRTAGTLDLRRLAVANIKQIETIKGPSSALWGSDALAGVVNIITDAPTKKMAGSAQIRAASFNSQDASVTLEQRTKRQGTNVFLNMNRTDGYDLDSDIAGQTAPSFQNYSAQLKQRFDFSDKTNLTLQGRFFTEDLDDSGAFGFFGENESAETNTQQTREWSFNPVFKTELAFGTRLTLRHYETRYQNTFANLEEGAASSDFNQRLTKSEAQVDYSPSRNHWITIGSGLFKESVNASRYVEKPAFSSLFVYAQHEWKRSERWDFTYGARLDRHSEYTAQLSPKFSARFQPDPNLTFRASAGRGFKAPDFRQLLLGFTNAVAGYSIFGSVALADAVRDLDASGQILTYFIDPASFGAIRAESSWAFNSGLDYAWTEKVQIRVNLFYNRISDMIDVRPVAMKTNGWSVYSYINLNSVVTRGAETEIRIQFSDAIKLSAGYQFLDARDRDVVDAIRDGKKFRAIGNSGDAEKVLLADYGGLFNRSRHMANVSLSFQPVQSNWSGTLRTQFRGRYGMGDLNRNDILDIDQEYASGYLLVNGNVQRKIFKNASVLFGFDNLFNYTNPAYQPFLAGRILYSTLLITFN